MAYLANLGLDPARIEQLVSDDFEELVHTIQAARDLGVGEHFRFPTIVAVGNRASGKSSVLEAIFGIKFPTSVSMGTRFTTSLTLRASPQTTITHRATPKKFYDEFEVTKGTNTISIIINEVKRQLDWHPNMSDSLVKDTLVIHATSPDFPALTIVDLPGYFDAPTDDKDTEMIARDIARGFMKQSNAIILAVISSTESPYDRQVLSKAAKYDPSRERTIGVVTKPDLLQAGSAGEGSLVRLIKGLDARTNLPLGWHVLCNPPAEGGDATQGHDQREEKFLASIPWISSSEFKKGTVTLRKTLSQVLTNNLRAALPKLITEIEPKLQAQQAKLKTISQTRSSPEELKVYLVDAADHFQKLASDGIHGRYQDKFFGALDLTHVDTKSNFQNARKLRSIIRNLNRGFVKALSMKGASYKLECEDSKDLSSNEVPEHVKPYLELYIAAAADTGAPSGLSLNTWIAQLASGNQGEEFPGSANTDLAVRLFQMQARPWRRIAFYHLQLVLKISQAFVEDLLSHVAQGDNLTSEALHKEFGVPFFYAKKTLLNEKLEELLAPYESGYGPARDDQFYSLSQAAEGIGHADSTTTSAERVGSKRRRVDPDALSNEFGTNKVLNLMMTHYQMSLTTFADNVINLAIETCLIRDLPNILSPKGVTRMPDAAVQQISALYKDGEREKQKLEKEILGLSSILQTCQRLRPREKTAAFFHLSQPLSRAASPAKLAADLPHRPPGAGLGQSDAPIDLTSAVPESQPLEPTGVPTDNMPCLVPNPLAAPQWMSGSLPIPAPVGRGRRGGNIGVATTPSPSLNKGKGTSSGH
ncbi:hypothetical protein GQ53DRAFT_796090 [Thozetella sp. PMI_491]|nr:hypothetical protein GQ53DRAFT_796090 [Thozetella sp. PMI_491]